MEMEYINDNTIRVFIEANDLVERGISFMDIMSNQQQVEKFFMSVLEEVDEAKKFQHSDAITFQVMPKKNGIDLYISKGLDGSDSDEADAYRHLIEAVEATSEDKNSIKNEDILEAAFSETDKGKKRIAVVFRDFNDFISFSRDFYLEYATVDLFTFANEFFALIEFDANIMGETEIIDFTYFILEYADLAEVAEAMIREHGKPLILNNAAEQIREKFKL